MISLRSHQPLGRAIKPIHTSKRHSVSVHQRDQNIRKYLISCSVFLTVSSCTAFFFWGLPSLAHVQNTPPSLIRARGSPDRVPVQTVAGLFGGSMGNKPDKIAQRKGWTASEEGVVERKMSKSGFDITPLTVVEREKWIGTLTDFQKHVAVDQGTERSFTGETVNGYPHSNKEKGVYVSAIGELPVFSSDTKYESGTGWPSFYAPIDPEHITEIVDTSIAFMSRVEIIDARGGAHLGHVFNDGPAPTGKRYCLNAAALKFIPEKNT